MKRLKYKEECQITIPDVLLIEGCDFESHPAGGQLAFARQLLQSFGNRFALVGVSTDETPVGRWVTRKIDGTTYHFFGVRRVDKTKTGRPLIPLRIRHYLAVRKYMQEIRSLGVSNVFTQCAQVMLAIHQYDWNSICYCFPSVKNEVEHSRYGWARLLKRPYERILFKALRRANLILAAADTTAIEAMVERSNGMVNRSRIVPCPTRADTRVFYPKDRKTARASLGLNQEAKILLFCGKLMYIKGWQLILESFKRLKTERLHLQLVLVGDGEDREKLKNMAYHLGIIEDIIFAGIVPSGEVALYMNAADALVVGSFQEGWSVAMVEAISCGLPIVSTNVSGARDLICNGFNGYVVDTRNPEVFAKAINSALNIKDAATYSLQIAEKYSLATLAQDLRAVWPVFSD
ncbi:glycosyltransferase involved in cell wall biosynthesis [Desulfosalsimonas propionicica]|uniref:Glycosyltransferase involved in cell wall biosynthesis n=1 Tax=Desulfosalsimonas propionicica TaxID=332175 RepID=A0A7W0C960_9BACT|nr:glycosyltransferase [Desulfosalsimonas propionicica]MBA2881471.1 glycosyltransferase involved in cell wall biosynthesis [Desulfosalsimonas propionicica]